MSTRAHLIHGARWCARVRCCAGGERAAVARVIHEVNRMNNVVEAILAISAGNAESCVRRTANEKKVRSAYSRSASQNGGEAELRDWGSQAGAWERDGMRWSLHGSGTKCGAASAKLPKLGSVECRVAMRQKALTGCELRRSLAPETGGKKRVALNFLSAKSFHEPRSELRGKAFPTKSFGRRGMDGQEVSHRGTGAQRRKQKSYCLPPRLRASV